MVGNWLKFNNSPLVANMKIRRSAYDGLNISKSIAPIFVDYDLCLGAECDFKILRFSFDEATFLSDSDLFPNNSTVILTINSITWANAQLRTLVNSLKLENPNTKTTLYDFIDNIAKDSNLNNDEYAISFNNNGYVYSGKDLIAYLYIRNTKTSSNTDTTQIQLVNTSFINICSHIAGVSGGCAGEKFDSSLPKSNIAKYNDLPVINNNCNPLNCGECHKNHITADNALCLVECPVNAIKYKATNTVDIVSSTEYKDSLDINFKRKNFSSYASGISDSDFINVHTSNNVLKATFLTIYNYILGKASSLLSNNTLVKRDSSGNFTANNITASLTGNADTSTNATNHIADVTGAVHGATKNNTANMIVRRDASGNFEANEIKANLNGIAKQSYYSQKAFSSVWFPKSPFKTVFIARLNGDNYDNSVGNMIQCTSSTDTTIVLNELPLDFINNLSGEWGIFYLNQDNAKKIQSVNIDTKTLTITSGGSGFSGQYVFLVCYSNIGTRVLRNSSELIENKASIESLFGFTTGVYVVMSQAFYDDDAEEIVILVYMKESATSFWSPHYVRYTISGNLLTRTGDYGVCITSEGANVMPTGKPYETAEYLYFPVLISYASPAYYKYTFMKYDKSAKTFSITGDDIFLNFINTDNSTTSFFVYPNYSGFDGEYHYITVLRRNSVVPTSEGQTEWVVYEFRSKNPLSGYTDQMPIVKSYDTWGCEHNYPEATYTFKNNGNTYIAVSGTTYYASSGLYANREYAIYKKLGFGSYVRDTRSPLIMNPLYAYNMGLNSFDGKYQHDHLGAGLSALTIGNNVYLFYTANSGTNTYGIFAVIKNELLEETQI